MCSVVACLSRAIDLSGSSSEDRETEGGGRPEITHLQDEERKNRLSHSVLPRPPSPQLVLFSQGPQGAAVGMVPAQVSLPDVVPSPGPDAQT